MKQIVAVVLALTLAVPAQASRTHSKMPKALDPGKAYVVVEIGKLDGALLDGTLVLARYDAAKGDVAEATAKPTAHKGDWALDNRVYLQKPVVKGEGKRLFLAELDPGLWVVEGTNDTAFSLGSSTLELAAGSVTDLGVVSVYSDFPEGEKRDVLTTGRLFKSALMGPLFGGRMPKPMPKAIDLRTRTAGDMSLPPLLGAAQGEYRWAGEVRFGNHLGGLVNRMRGRKARAAAAEATATAVAAAPAGER